MAWAWACLSPLYFSCSFFISGASTCILHYVENNAQLKDGDLLLIDAGGELEGYTADITRTFPVNGKFSKAQQAIYEVVLEANVLGPAH